MANPKRVKVPYDPLLIDGSKTNAVIQHRRSFFTTNANQMFDPSSSESSDGGDQRMFDQDETTELDREIYEFSLDTSTNAEDGTCEIYVRIPFLDGADTDPHVFVEYGDNSLPDYAPSGTH